MIIILLKVRISNEIGESTFTVKVDQSRGCHCRYIIFIILFTNEVTMERATPGDCQGRECQGPEGPKPPHRDPGGPIKVIREPEKVLSMG